MESCLICVQDVTDGSFPQEDKVLGRQLRAVFVLLELLRLPPGKLADFLALSGGDRPDTWISLCSDCEALVEKAFDLYQEKQRIHRKINEMGQELVSKLKKGDREPGTQNEGGEGAVRLQIVEETRSFVRHYEYERLENPFLVGDWEAEWRLTAPVEVKQEVEETGGNNDEEVEEPFSAASPESFPESSDSETPERPTLSRSRKKPKGKGKSKHIIRVHYKCPVKGCHRTLFTSQQGVIHHRKLHKRPSHPVEPLPSQFPCPLERCSSVLACRVNLGKHVRTVHGMDPRSLGRKKMSSRGPLKRLTSDPAISRTLIPCSVSGCLARVINRSSLNKHLRNIHSIGIPTQDTAKKPRKKREKREGDERQAPKRVTRLVCKVKDCFHKCLSQSDLRHHRRTQHAAEFPFQCSEEGCNFCSAIKWELNTHMKSKHGKSLTSGPFACEICQKEFPKMTGLLCHRRQVHTERPRYPRLPVSTLQTVSVSRSTTATNRMEQCPQCGVMVKQLPSHTRSVHEGGSTSRRFHCEHCGHATVTNARLIQHQAKEHHICGVFECQVRLGSREKLHRHQLDAHGGQFDVFQCTQPDCKMLFITKRHLQKHVQRHEIRNESGGVAGHVCELCGKSFLTADYLYYHNWHTHQKRRKKKGKKQKEDQEEPDQTL